MSDIHGTSSNPPSRLKVLLAMAAMGVMGAIMLLHGLGLVSANWLNPNPFVPHWIFALIGVILLLGAWLALGLLKDIPAWARNTAGTLLVGLSIVMMHWLVFFAEGASCGAATQGLTLQGTGSLCGVVMGGAVIVLDLILIAVALAMLWSYLRGKAGT